MTIDHEHVAREAITFLLDTGPEEWAAIPEHEINPQTFAALLELEIEAKSKGLDINFGDQSWVDKRLRLAVRVLEAKALEFEQWARSNDRQDLLATTSELAFNSNSTGDRNGLEA
ncbi:hypothetical protein QNA24_29800 [Rhodococcus qingshengii]|uniref:hypothetical protein n=1 Tax=Rhodococcus TaxID=1827 RepID=UPI001E3774A6|nr:MULTISPECIES: hypothetical protein [Rhodococcus]MCD2099567.1 hypothetical protein [Rhodococcus rhodochrous]MCD2123935.1 hypothetical protein [Rhodococcus rhodochrous]MCQ4136636.1 hypothetical protein [Rhodococcus rhodochrous]MDJ0490578.1 hypothetical protein [Rhodococcus qingshengii]